ncbi:MAG: hypothetical protein JO227_19580 [Acetobacteraceae bacterium]|nr:hypothetical protein [Acetobacteraceae bacterium]
MSKQQSVRSELKAEIEALRTEVKGELALLRKGKPQVELRRRDVTVKLGGMMVVSVGIVIAAMRFIPVHP